MQPSERTRWLVENRATSEPHENMSWLEWTAGSLSRLRRAATPKVVAFSKSEYFWDSGGCEKALGSRSLFG